MTEDELRNYLRTFKITDIFDINELNESIFFVYHITMFAYGERCDKIEVSDRQVIWYKNNIAHEQTTISRNKFRSTVKEVRKRDAIMQQHLQLIAETKDSSFYRLVFTSSE